MKSVVKIGVQYLAFAGKDPNQEHVLQPRGGLFCNHEEVCFATTGRYVLQPRGGIKIDLFPSISFWTPSVVGFTDASSRSSLVIESGLQ